MGTFYVSVLIFLQKHLLFYALSFIMNTYYAYYSGVLCNQARPSRTRLQMANSVYTALKPLEIRQVFPAAFALSKSAFAYLKLLRTHKR